MSNTEVQFTWRHTHPENTVEKEHKHDAIEMVYYLRGEGDTIIDGKKYPYKAGTVCYIPQGVIHSEYHKAETEVLFFGFHIASEMYAEMEAGVYEDEQEQLLKIFTNIEKENKDRGIHHRRMMGALTNQLMILLIRSVDSSKVILDELPKAMQEVCKYIRLNSHMDLSAIEIAKQKGYSYDYFRHQFKKYCGIGLKEFIQHERRNAVIDRLLCSEESIYDIAKKYNFSDVPTFSKWFKKMTGLSPTAYRKQFKKNENVIQVVYPKRE